MLNKRESDILRTARNILQCYHEYNKLLASLYNVLNAIANMTHQKENLESAVRRNRSFTPDLTRYDHNLYVENEHDNTLYSCNLQEWTSLCVTGSLGVLLAFPLPITEHLIGQYQLDQSRLLQSASELQQKLSSKTKQIQTAITSLEEMRLSVQDNSTNKNDFNKNININNNNNSKNTSNSINKREKSNKSIAVPYEHIQHAETNEFISLFSNNDKLFDLTGLENVPQLIHASYAIIRVMIKMNSLTQESILALRKDLFSKFIRKNYNTQHYNLSTIIADNDSTISKLSMSVNTNEERGRQVQTGVHEKITQDGDLINKAHLLSNLFEIEEKEEVQHHEFSNNISPWIYSHNKLLIGEANNQKVNAASQIGELVPAKKVYALSDALDKLPNFLQSR